MMDLGKIVIRCDHDGCHRSLDTGTSSPHRARDVARRNDWSTRLSTGFFSQAVEFCPEHKDEHLRDTVDGNSF